MNHMAPNNINFSLMIQCFDLTKGFKAYKLVNYVSMI